MQAIEPLMLRKLIKQSLSVAGLRIVGTGLSVGVSIGIARLFGAEALGVYAYCIALLGLAAVPISNGWSAMVLRAVSKEGIVSGTARAMTWMGAGGALIMAILAGTMGLIAIDLAQTEVAVLLKPIALPVVGLIAFTLLCDQISAMRMASIRGVDRPAVAQIPEVLVRPLLLLSGMFLGWHFYGVRGTEYDLPMIFAALALAALIAFAIGQVVMMVITERQPRVEVTNEQRKSWIASAAALAGSAGLVQLNGYVDMLLLGSFAPAADVGLYRAALQIAMLASFGYIALNMLAGQRFSNFLAKNDRESVARTATLLARLALLSAIPLPLIIWFFGPELLSLLFGAEFSGSATPALIIAIGFCFSASIGMAHSLLIMSHYEVLALRLTAVALAINVTLCLILIPPFGLVGAACANMVAAVSWNALLWWFARKHTGFDTSLLGMPAKPAPQA